MLEWSHRLIALLEGLVIVGTIVTGLRVRKQVAGVTPAFYALGAIFVAQVLLGAATVRLANSPVSVMVHWAMGMALLATLTSLAVLSVAAPVDGCEAGRPARPPRTAAVALAIAALFAFVTMCAGAYVSSSYAGLACPGVPGCGATWWGTTTAQNVQMLHRLLAGSFAFVALVAVTVAFGSGSSRVRLFAGMGLTLIVTQIALGLANVGLSLPTGLREAHAANAVATFLTFVVAALLAHLGQVDASVPRREPVLAARFVSNA